MTESADTPTPVRRICRWDLPDLCLQPTTNSHTHVVRTLQALEERLEAATDDANHTVNAVQYKLPADVVWTQARRALRPAHSILGLLETMPDEGAERTCVVRVYHQVPVAVNANSFQARATGGCDCPHPKYYNYSTSSELAPPPDPPDAQQPITTTIDWMDFSTTTTATTTDEVLFPTPRSVLHALRSLLGVDHDASPWGAAAPTTSPITTTTTTTTHVSSSHADVVVVALPSSYDDEDVLTRFRVSDACPSWALHAVVPTCRRIAWESETTTRSPSNVTTSTLTNNTTALLIYKRLPPRDCLSRFHPETGQGIPVKDCLWQSLVVQSSTEESSGLESGTSHVQHRLVAPPYLDLRVHYPGMMEALAAHLDEMRQEATEIAHWTAWPEQQHYQAAGDGTTTTPWNVFPLCYCFPAHAIENRVWVPVTNACVPRTVEILRTVLGDTLRTALFSRLEPGAVLEAHSGWSDLANYVVRLHVPLVIPTGHLCGTWVDGCTATHTNDDDDAWLCFDDSKIHRAFNYSSEPRIVLILDLERPTDWPRGTATGGHSDELDAFIQQMSAPR
jgi:hypothetical protein